MRLTFDHEMQFPSDLIDIINNQAGQSESKSDQSIQTEVNNE